MTADWASAVHILRYRNSGVSTVILNDIFYGSQVLVIILNNILNGCQVSEDIRSDVVNRCQVPIDILDVILNGHAGSEVPVVVIVLNNSSVIQNLMKSLSPTRHI